METIPSWRTIWSQSEVNWPGVRAATRDNLTLMIKRTSVHRFGMSRIELPEGGKLGLPTGTIYRRCRRGKCCAGNTRAVELMERKICHGCRKGFAWVYGNHRSTLNFSNFCFNGQVKSSVNINSREIVLSCRKGKFLRTNENVECFSIFSWIHCYV